MDLVFQAVCWKGDDFPEGDQGEEEPRLHYKVLIFGRTLDGASVCVTSKFFPYFYISLPKGYTQVDAESLKLKLIEKMGRRHKGSVLKDSCDVVSRKKFFGFTNGESFKFLRMVFTTRHAYAVAAKIMADSIIPERAVAGEKIALYESNVDPVLKLMHCRNLQSAGWIRIPSGKFKTNEAPMSHCTIDVLTRYDALEPADIESPAPLVMASFDIEANSRDGNFPNPDEPGNEVIQIATVFQRYGEAEPYAKHVLCLGETRPVEGAETTCYETEPELLAAWSDLIKQHHTDILFGYNIWGFDMEFMYKRAMFNFGAEAERDAFLNCSKLRGVASGLKKTVLSSSAYGHNEFLILETPGILQVDLLHVLRKEHKLESYSLNKVSEHFLNDHKLDMPAWKMFELYRQGPEEKGLVADYCVKDAELPLRIANKLAVIPNMVEMAKATHVPLEFLIPRGQQIKVFSQILKRLRDKGYVCPTNPRGGGSAEGYTGATVLEPKRGAYLDDIVVCLDYASLYPSIMRAYNLCHSTIVLDSAYDNLPGVEYLTVDIEGMKYRFAQNVEGIMPALLADLAAYRKAAKKKMEAARAAGDGFMYKVHNGAQLAYKISMNSIYGFCGATNGFLPCQPIAAAVTCIGRSMIETTKRMVEENFPGAEVVYGDSVLPYTPVVVKNASTGQISVKTIQSLGELWESYDGFKPTDHGLTQKEQAQNVPYLAWTHQGWAPIKRVIRHKCQKRIYRVLTHTGVVDVTEDHSLLDKSVQQIKPKDAHVGMRLLHGLPSETCGVETITTDQAYIYGMFVGDGSGGRYKTKHGIKYSWALNNKDRALLESCKAKLERVHGQPFKVLETLESSGVLKLVPCRTIKPLVEHYRRTCYDDKAKRIPAEVMFGTSEVRVAFLQGLWDSDGCRKDNEVTGCHRIDTKNQLTAQWYFMLLASMGYNVSINTREDKPDIFRLTFTKKKQRKDAEVIKKIHVLHKSYEGHVYDLETDQGVFQAGVGRLIVKNTDSVMVKFPSKDMHECFKLGREAAEYITSHFKHPICLEFEKCYASMMLFAKKRYCGLMYTKADAPDYIDAKGIQLVRRDNCPLVRTVSKAVLDKLMYQRDTEGAIQLVRQTAQDLLENKVDTKQLVLSKTLKPEKEYKNTAQPHLYVARKIEERNGIKGSGPKSGERVPYVFIDTPDPTALQCSKAESPAYAAEHNLPIDFLYYLEHQLESPMIALFELLVDNPEEALFEDLKKSYIAERQSRVKEFKRVSKLKKDRQHEITSFFKPVAK
jgi:DNA polymerase elongation subunit (family B)